MISGLCKLVKYLHIISKKLQWESMITLQDFKRGTALVMWPTWTVRWIQCHNNGGKKQKDSKQQESSSFPHPCSHGLWLPIKAATSVKHKSGKLTQHKHHSLRKLWASCWINPLRLKPHINLQVSRNDPVPGYGAVPAVSSPKHTTQKCSPLSPDTSHDT